MKRPSAFAACAAALLWAACGAGTSVQPKLSSIQAQVFTPSCAFTSCHGGAGGVRGLDLTDGHAWASLVNVPGDDGGVVRVAPGSPDLSLLYQVLLNRVGTVERMPQGGDPLPADQAKAIHDWISNGAHND